MKQEEIETVRNWLSSPKKIAIIPHRSPDGDAMGSTLGLYHFLLKFGHDPLVVVPNEFPDFLAWMPGSEATVVYEKDRENVSRQLEKAELVFTLDFNALHRTGEMETVLKRLKVPFIMIDHHQHPEDYAAVRYSETRFGSTCEMLYNFIGFLGHEGDIDHTIATCIYTGIMTDSGNFRFPSTSSTTHRIAADLIDKGVDNARIYSQVYDSNSYERMQLVGRALQNMKLIPEKKTSYITLSQEELDTFRYIKGDTEGVVNYGLSVKGIVFTAIFIEHRDENIIKISFRSKGDFDVNRFARTHFNGGGHINAAGGKSNDSLAETVRRFQKLVADIEIHDYV
ncbi:MULTISPECIES: bifunctional oligoribonuclease/PAP phosphatase NrnA [unclassified Flavobacterium]|uniref:DHH family phosphoesterase n=1 Tax=unclassified Flavobacterium TaxID=196869 RepID=UPI001F137F8F|nr:MULTISPECIES: bifunctional oligoribonuclease/PAP phosphatase NrnA [unclassified Flavobacterium]UMY64391.1 bifunctional oligoribonuclease/PAP phosphatase NrnA [Flavobacterium sp. HJ-32-4]